MGIRSPYHPLPLDERWEHRRPLKRMFVRWGALAVTPYGLVPVLSAVALAPALVLWQQFAGQGLTGRLTTAEFARGVLLACAVGVAGALGGHHVGVGMIRRRRDKLVAYLSDPMLG